MAFLLFARFDRLARLAIALVAVAVGTPADALQITGLSVTLGGTNTASSLTNSGNNRMQIASATNVVLAPGGAVADTPGSSTQFGTRYASLLAADREGGGGGSTGNNMTSNYQITFTVDNPTGGQYQIDIDTLRLGALTNFDDDAGTSTQTIGAVTGRLDTIIDPNLAMSAVGPYSTGTTGTSAINQAGTTLSIIETALTRTYVLDFNWTANTNSAKDEAAIRLGIAGGLSTTTADDYPGVGARTAANDGHFVNVKATYLMAVPEPGTGLLLALGLLGVAASRTSRRRSH